MWLGAVLPDRAGVGCAKRLVVTARAAGRADVFAVALNAATSNSDLGHNKRFPGADGMVLRRREAATCVKGCTDAGVWQDMLYSYVVLVAWMNPANFRERRQ